MRKTPALMARVFEKHEGALKLGLRSFRLGRTSREPSGVFFLARIIHKRDYEGKRCYNSTRKHVHKCVYGSGER